MQRLRQDGVDKKAAGDAFPHQTAVEIGHHCKHRFNLLLGDQLLEESTLSLPRGWGVDIGGLHYSSANGTIAEKRGCCPTPG